MAVKTTPETTFNYFGSAWSFWSPGNARGDLNIVSGVACLSSRIISICLILQGELPLHPEYGSGLQIFQPLSDVEPQYLVYNLREEILRWVKGLVELSVVAVPDETRNKMLISIDFIHEIDPFVHTLTFPFFRYEGTPMDENFAAFLSSISLDGAPFAGLV